MLQKTKKSLLSPRPGTMVIYSLIITAAAGRGGRFELWLRLVHLPNIDRINFCMTDF